MRTISCLMNLSGRKALITGGAGHIGRVAAETLLELGARVALVDLNANACKAEAKRMGHETLAFPCDLADEKAIRQVVRAATARMKGLDILIHCAAYVGTTKVPGWAVPFGEQSLEAWEKAMSINLGAAFIMAQEAQEPLTVSGHGSIIFLSSIYGMVGPDMSLYKDTTMMTPAGYAASKGGILQLMRYLATIMAPKIRVNVISPGGVLRNQPVIFMERYNKRAPLERMATEEDIKGAVAYLAGDLSAYVTGHNLVVDGGWTAW
ncbi:MAG: SDR family oxidoreductase [Planctomycetes bacterium]|nr:SDR family oxidoreductase [Verrucomicrobiota bacterium]MBU4274087.1 SDR family oxidoreductase [Planctomycetota bacterium]MCG2680986.1 SDR family oxidoreductase [Kiritimatiellia bacterium]